MQNVLSAAANWISYPPALSLCIFTLALLTLLSRWSRAGAMLLSFALFWSLAWSLPLASDWIRAPLETRYLPRDAASLPRADAIVVLGGGDYAWVERRCLDPCALESSRLAGAARAWRAGRAPFVILSGTADEVHWMRRALDRLNVPAGVVLADANSRSTRQNARHTAALADAYGWRRVILTTSALHMPRAMLEFRGAGLHPVASPIPENAPRARHGARWLPSRTALWRSGRAFKEYLGIAAARTAIGASTRKSCRIDSGIRVRVAGRVILDALTLHRTHRHPDDGFHPIQAARRPQHEVPI